MRGWVWLLVVVAGAVVLDQVLLALERRGLVYWRRRDPPRGAGSTALLSVQALFEPAAEHVVEQRQQAASEIEEAADDESR